GVVPPGLVLPEEEWEPDADLAEVAREMAVPEERHPLRERRRRAEQVVEPPLLQGPDVDRAGAAGVVSSGKRRRLGGGRLQQPADGLLVAVGEGLLDIGRAGAEGRP